MSPDTLYWLAICSFAGAIAYSEFLDRNATDDPFGDAPHGDIPAIPQDLKVSRFHAERNAR
jgi:hypothetical protein